MKQIGKNIKKHRQARGMTQDQLAEKLNVTRQAVSSWETGKTQPDIGTLTALAEHLGISMEVLIYGKNRGPVLPPVKETGTGVIFGTLFLLFMMVLLFSAEALFRNIWWRMMAVSAILSGLITALIRQSDRLDTLAERIEQLENP